MIATQRAEATAAAVKRLSPWFHNLHLPDGTQTAPDHPLGDFPAFKWQRIAPHLPLDLSGWEVLDIGCNAAFYSFELARRGARVLGIDADPHYLAQARWAAGQFGLQNCVKFRQMQVYDLTQLDQQFDLVLFMGVFYHLRYPLLGLDIVAQKVKKLMIFQSLTMPGPENERQFSNQPRTLSGIGQRDLLLQSAWPKMAFIPDSFVGDPTNWWIPNPTAIRAMLRSSGMRILSSPDDEIYLCEHIGPITGYGAFEQFCAATGCFLENKDTWSG
jgi:tRNA (mo5U34)-methyltransferase